MSIFLTNAKTRMALLLHVATLAWRRIRQIAATMDIEAAELLSSLLALGLAFVMALPGDYLQSNPALVELARHAAEWVYATLLALLGAFQLLACVLGGFPSALAASPASRSLWLIARLYGLRAAVGMWVTLGILITAGGGYMGAVFYTIAVGFCVWGSSRVAKLMVADREAQTMRWYAENVVVAEMRTAHAP